MDHFRSVGELLAKEPERLSVVYELRLDKATALLHLDSARPQSSVRVPRDIGVLCGVNRLAVIVVNVLAISVDHSLDIGHVRHNPLNFLTKSLQSHESIGGDL